MTIATPTSTYNKTTKVKRPREDRFCLFAFLLFEFCFVVGLFHAFVKLRKFFITKNLVLIFKLNIIESFYYRERLHHNFGFFLFLVIILEK
jgi:hypothetical protein